MAYIPKTNRKRVAKLPDETVATIRRLFLNGERPVDIAVHVGLKVPTVHSVVKRSFPDRAKKYRRPSLNDAQRARAIELYHDGVLHKDIAKELQCPTSQVSVFLISQNLYRVQDRKCRYAPRFTEEQNALVIELFKDGMSYAEIAREMDASIYRISRLVRKHWGGPAPSPDKRFHMTLTQKAKVLEMARAGVIYREIAAEVASTESTVRKFANYNGIRRQRLPDQCSI